MKAPDNDPKMLSFGASNVPDRALLRGIRGKSVRQRAAAQDALLGRNMSAVSKNYTGSTRTGEKAKVSRSIVGSRTGSKRTATSREKDESVSRSWTAPRRLGSASTLNNSVTASPRRPVATRTGIDLRDGNSRIDRPGKDKSTISARFLGGATPPKMGGQRRSVRECLAAYVALTKPRIIEQLLITTVPAMVLAYRGWPSTWLVIATVFGGALAAGGANTINMVIDRDIDAVMQRTKDRPLVTGAVTPRAALIYAIVLEVLAFGLLSVTSNLLAGALALAATLFYVFVYTLWLKRTSTHNIVIGGAAGAVPALVGWAAVTGSLSWSAWILFTIVFLWTPPHFWALAVRYQDDYARAEVPMLPVVVGIAETTKKMLIYSIVLVTCSFVLIPVGPVGWIYGVTAVTTGGAFLVLCERVRRNPTPKAAMRVFTFSISYLTALCVALVLDQLLIG